ncbi:MAG: DUF4194 domain-containing protein [Gallionella sp.]
MTDYSPALPPLLIQLLKGVLYREQMPNRWQELLQLEGPVRDYLSVIGLELDLDDTEGFAYLRQREANEGEDLPKLFSRRPLSYPVSLLCILLRKRLLESDASNGELRTMISREEIIDRVRTFLPESSNEARIEEQIDTHIRRVVDMGFLRELNEQRGTYEIRRVLKAFVDAEWLADFNENLDAYRNHALD